jgi:AraC-like DNA-binding protein
MLDQDYLALQLNRLQSPGEWTPNGQGLSFLFPKEGVGKYVSGPVAERLSPGDALVFNGRRAGKICAVNGGETVFWSFSLCLEDLFPLFAANEISLLKQVAESLKGVKRYPASTPLAAECHRLISEIPPQFNLDHRGQLVRVAAAVLAEEFKTAEGKQAGFVRIEDHILQVFNKLSTQELLTLSVGELADRFGCSRRHLNRLFHRHFGFSAAALKMEVRLRKAVSLLRDPDIKVSNLAGECGFGHLGSFRTCFKRRFGTSPGEWRKAAAQAKGTPTAQREAVPDRGKTSERFPVAAGGYRTPQPLPSSLLLSIKALNPGGERATASQER